MRENESMEENTLNIRMTKCDKDKSGRLKNPGRKTNISINKFEETINCLYEDNVCIRT